MVFSLITGAIDSVKWVIDFVVDKFPKPLKIVLFLMILLLFFSFIPTFLHLFGVHCYSDGTPAKLGTMNLIKNYNILTLDETDVTHPFNVSVDGACVVGVCNVSGEFYYDYEAQCNGKTITYLYNDDYFGFDCVDCATHSDIVVHANSSVSARGFSGYCDSDAFAIDDEDLTFWSSVNCPASCHIEPNYYWNATSGLYECANLDVCGLNITDRIYKVDELLDSYGAERLTVPGDNEEDIKKVIGYDCDSEFNPHMTFMGIPIFDYELWIVLFVIAGLFIFLNKIKRH